MSEEPRFRAVRVPCAVLGRESSEPPRGTPPPDICPCPFRRHTAQGAERGVHGFAELLSCVLCQPSPEPIAHRVVAPVASHACSHGALMKNHHGASNFPRPPQTNSKTKNPTQMCPATSAARLRFYRFVFCFVSFPVPRRWMAPVSPRRIVSKTADALSKLIAIIQSDVFNPRKKFRLASQPLLPPRGSRCPFPASSSCRVGGTRRCSRGARELCPANRG